MDANIPERIITFDEKDAASRVLPFKDLSDVVMAKHDNKRRAPVRVMQLTIADAFKLFCNENEDVKITKRAFGNYRPKTSKSNVMFAALFAAVHIVLTWNICATNSSISLPTRTNLAI